MPKAVIKFVFEVYGMDCWRTYLHMPKSVITFMFKVLRTGLLRCILYTCPKLLIKFVFKVLRNGLCFRRFRVFAVFAVSRVRFFPFPCFAFSCFRVFVFRRRHPRGRDTDFLCTGSYVSEFVLSCGLSSPQLAHELLCFSILFHKHRHAQNKAHEYSMRTCGTVAPYTDPLNFSEE